MQTLKKWMGAIMCFDMWFFPFVREELASRETGVSICFHLFFQYYAGTQDIMGKFSEGRSQANAVAQQALIAHWQSIVKSLDNSLKTMKANNVSFTVSHRMSAIVFLLEQYNL